MDELPGQDSFLQGPLTCRLPSASLARCSLLHEPSTAGPCCGCRAGSGSCPQGGQAEVPPHRPPTAVPFSLPPGPAPRAVSPSWASHCLAGCPEEPATESPRRAAQRPGGWEVKERPRKGCPWVPQRLGDQLQRTYFSIRPIQGNSETPSLCSEGLYSFREDPAEPAWGKQRQGSCSLC